MTASISVPSPRLASVLRKFLESSAAGGIVLMVAAALAMLVANSPFASLYFEVLHAYLGGLSVLHWINDGLMAIFFLFVGLEIKREFVDGRLATWDQRRLPVLAAATGMIVPAIIISAFRGQRCRARQWLGDPRGDRYRLRHRRLSPARQACANLAQAVPRHCRDR